MKKDIHAENYRLVVFKDATNGDMFLAGSTIGTTETVKYTDGKEYPLYMVETSSTSHPFYTGQEKALGYSWTS
jgi:large subunit ribosomal protein L31